MLKLPSFALAIPLLSLAILLTAFLFVNPSFTSDKIASIGKYEVTKQEAELATNMAGLGEFDRLSVDEKKVVLTRLLHDKAIEADAKKEKT